MEKFFEKRGDADDAVRWSREGREFAIRAQADLAALAASFPHAAMRWRLRTAAATATSTANRCKPESL